MAGYVKITFEDIEIAKNFFENEKHLDEFLVNVCKYYCGYENVFKYKNVKKFFETYKKTMDRVILGRTTGSIGGKKRIENQQDTIDTLEGVLEGGIKDPVQPKLIKEIKLKKETSPSTEQSSEDFFYFFRKHKSDLMEGFDVSSVSEEFKKYYLVANYFRKQVIELTSKSGGSLVKLNNAKIDVWVKPIRDMYEIDKINGDTLKAICDWVKKDSFWSKNILSTSKLREQFNALVIKANITTQSERKLLRLPQEYESYIGMDLGILLSRIKTTKGVEYIPDITKAQYDSLPRDSFNMYESLIKSGNCKIIEE